MKGVHPFKYIRTSKFVKSIFLQTLAIVLAASIAIVAIVFFSFTMEINKNIVEDRQKKLAVIEETISKRMSEITSIAYNISNDSRFYIEPVEGVKYSGYEMSNALSKYLIGNDFIKYIGYYRVSESNELYTSSGEMTFNEFWSACLKLKNSSRGDYISLIQNCKVPQVLPLAQGDPESYFTYVCPLPQYSENPQAFIIVLIPLSEAGPLLSSEFDDTTGEMLVFDGSGKEIYHMSNLDVDIPLSINEVNDSEDKEYIKVGGSKYVVQKQVSNTNGWTFVSVSHYNEMISGLAYKQLIFIVLLLGLMLIAVFAMLYCIIKQYRPIRNLADDSGDNKGIMDETEILSNKIANLQDDSDQKQMFESAYYKAEAANKAKSIFLSNMSHDIRTPMNAIIGMTSLAHKHSDNPVYVKECLEKVQVSSQYLLDIINNVLDMSRIESGKITLSNGVIDLKKLAEDLNTIMSQSTNFKGQKLIIDSKGITNSKVMGDKVRLTQIFVNILSNSVKFTPIGGTIKLNMRQSESVIDGDGEYIFIFKDNGVGMSPEFIEHVFDAFSRSKEADESNVEGNGLGMAIVKNLVELMGGTITCESELNVGTTFTITINMKLCDDVQDEVNDELVEDVSTVDLTGKRILLVEDNAMNREIAGKILEETHVEVVTATNGKEAVETFEKCEDGYFDLILMDIQMPVMDGYGATRSIRESSKAYAKNVKIYAMTANTFEEDIRAVKDAGMDGHIPKPYTPKILYNILAKAFKE